MITSHYDWEQKEQAQKAAEIVEAQIRPTMEDGIEAVEIAADLLHDNYYQ